MHHKPFRLRVNSLHSLYGLIEVMAVLAVVLFVVVSPTSAAMRFQDRSLLIDNARPGVATNYTVSFRYMSPVAVGSVELLFCNDPIPHHECVTPVGLDASGAQLESQAGEEGFSIGERSTNRIVITRPSTVITSSGTVSSYVFKNITNPTDTSQAYSVRLKSHASSNATGQQIDFGSVRAQVTDDIIIQTQVPPMLIFCVAEQVSMNCTNTNKRYYADMGELNPQSTLAAQSQMAVGTNASGGFAITAHGTPMVSGTNVIEGLKRPSESRPGVSQFGINLASNATPRVGSDPEGEWSNAVPANDYATPDRYKYVPGDVVAHSPNVSLMRKFTVSYIVNSDSTLHPGVYTTTITYVASGRF